MRRIVASLVAYIAGLAAAERSPVAAIHLSGRLSLRASDRSPLIGADLIASQFESERWPLERDLAESLDPARHLQRALRQSLVE